MALSTTASSLPDVNTSEPHDSLIKFYKWTFENFMSHDFETGKAVNSLIFSVNNATLKWHLVLYPNGSGENSAGHLSLFLCLEHKNNLSARAQCEFSILDAKLEKKHTLKTEMHLYDQEAPHFGFSKFINRNILLEKIDTLLPDGKLTIFCEIRVFSEVPMPGTAHLKEPECTLSDDLGKLVLNAKFSDVTLAIGELEFPAHKAMLTMRSDVFAAMFEHEMEEKRLNRITITDVEPDVLRGMLRYIYTGKVPNLDKIAAPLFSVADKYDIANLKLICEMKLYEQLSMKSAVETLILADLHNAEQLKKQAMEFITVHAIDVMETSAWQNMTTAYPCLLAEAYRAIAKQAHTTTCTTTC